MHLYQTRSESKTLILPAAVFLILFCLFWAGFSGTSDWNSAQSRKVMQTAIQKSIVNCYAVEGVYPPNIQYLENHYGLIIDHNKYIVDYESVGSNVMPSVKIFDKN